MIPEYKGSFTNGAKAMLYAGREVGKLVWESFGTS